MPALARKGRTRGATTRAAGAVPADLTKIPTRAGCVWLVGVIDCHDRDLIGHRYGTSADTTPCLTALGDAGWERFPDQLALLEQTAPQLSRR